MSTLIFMYYSILYNVPVHIDMYPLILMYIYSSCNDMCTLIFMYCTFKGLVSRYFPAQTAYIIIHLQITSLFMYKKDFASFCKLAEIFALLSHSELSGTALSANLPLSGTALSDLSDTVFSCAELAEIKPNQSINLLLFCMCRIRTSLQ
jgi:hypothetical protein